MKSEKILDVDGVLCDLDGVIWLEEEPYPGAADVIRYIKEELKLPCRFVTNTTTRSLDTLHRKALRLGMPVERDELVTPPRLGAAYLRRFGKPSVFLVTREDTKADFAEFPQSDTAPDWVVIGNYDDGWDYALIDRVFNFLLNGAKLLAMHRQRYWQTARGLQVDIGCFVTGLEYSAGVKAIVIGKPEPLFFQTALEEMGVAPERAIMIGDDIESDIGGSQSAGARGILLRTGKYREELIARSIVKPYRVIDSIADLRRLL